MKFGVELATGSVDTSRPPRLRGEDAARLGLAASVIAFAAWARKQIVRWGELIRPLFPTPPGEGTPVDLRVD